MLRVVISHKSCESLIKKSVFFNVVMNLIVVPNGTKIFKESRNIEVVSLEVISDHNGKVFLSANIMPVI